MRRYEWFQMLTHLSVLQWWIWCRLGSHPSAWAFGPSGSGEWACGSIFGSDREIILWLGLEWRFGLHLFNEHAQHQAVESEISLVSTRVQRRPIHESIYRCFVSAGCACLHISRDCAIMTVLDNLFRHFLNHALLLCIHPFYSWVCVWFLYKFFCLTLSWVSTARGTPFFFVLKIYF